MLTEERHSVILNRLKQSPTVSLQELVEDLEHSESTIRRDLSQLEKEGSLVRIHGGAKRHIEMTAEDTMDEKSVKNVHEKQTIAKIAESLIEDEDVIFLDAGTTTFEIIPLLSGKSITVVTNGVPHASMLTDLNVDTILIGGRIKQSTKAVVGTQAEIQLRQYRFDKAFMGMNAVDIEFGFTTPDIEEAGVKQIAIKQTNQPFVLVDSTKMNATSFVRVAEIDDCTIITSQLTPETENIKNATRVLEGDKN